MAKQKKTPAIQIRTGDAEIICRDFEAFCKYLVEHKAKLSKTTAHIGKKDCFELNRLFHRKEEYEKATRFQKHYPVIHFFYYVALKYHILELNAAETGMVYGRNYTLFQNAPILERYTLFLLNFLYDVNFLRDKYALSHIRPFFQWYETTKPETGNVYPCMYGVFPDEYSSEKGITAHLEELRLIRIQRKGEMQAAFVPWEIEVLPALNAVFRLYHEIHIREEGLWEKEKKIESFFLKSMDVLEPGQKKYTLSEIFMPAQIEILDQTVDLEVSMRHYDCSRTIRMNQRNSLYDLHMMIQEAFGFDNDHLYEFYVGKEPLQKTYSIPEAMGSEEAESVYETALGKLSPRKGMKFTYLFDFGDSWWFEIKVVKIADGSVSQPVIVKSKNPAPMQYPMWDMEYDEEYDEDYDEDYDEEE